MNLIYFWITTWIILHLIYLIIRFYVFKSIIIKYIKVFKKEKKEKKKKKKKKEVKAVWKVGWGREDINWDEDLVGECGWGRGKWLHFLPIDCGLPFKSNHERSFKRHRFDCSSLFSLMAHLYQSFWNK